LLHFLLASGMKISVKHRSFFWPGVFLGIDYEMVDSWERGLLSSVVVIVDCGWRIESQYVLGL